MIDETKKLENDFSLNLMLEAPGHFYWKDTEGYIRGANNTQAVFLGCKSGRDLIGKTDFDFFPKEIAEKIVEIDRKVMDTGEEYQIEETVPDCKGQNYIFFSRKLPLYEPHTKKVIGVIGTSLDITKQKQAERAKNAFIMNMAHDIRTPFCGIIGFAQLQEQGTLKTPDEVKEYGKIIHESGNQLLEILDFVIVALDKNDIEHIRKNKIDLYGFAREMQALIKPNVSLNNLEFELKVDEGIGEIVTDKIRLKQILANILSNAVKFTPKGKITLSFEWIYLNHKRDRLRINVSDTGIGIDKSNHERIFNKFEKIKPSYESSTFTGCGMGLYLVKQLIEKLNGKINLASRLGNGSTFQVEIPFID